jgi:hypothetical protein
MADPYERFYQIKTALVSAGLNDLARAMDVALNDGCSLECAWELVGVWRGIVRNRPYDDALAKMAISNNDSECAANLLYKLRRYAERQYQIDRESGRAPVGETAALFVILTGDGGQILELDTYRKKFARLSWHDSTLANANANHEID